MEAGWRRLRTVRMFCSIASGSAMAESKAPGGFHQPVSGAALCFVRLNFSGGTKKKEQNRDRRWNDLSRRLLAGGW